MNYQKFRKNIINKIKELANAKGMSIRQICIISHVSSSTVYKFFSDPNATLTLDTLDKLCHGLGTNFNEFFSDSRFNKKSY